MTAEPKQLHPVEKSKPLTMAERVAVEALMADVARAQQRLRALFLEIGLDPDKRYSMQADGVVVET